MAGWLEIGVSSWIIILFMGYSPLLLSFILLLERAKIWLVGMV
jgi:hypothetical protein